MLPILEFLRKYRIVLLFFLLLFFSVFWMVQGHYGVRKKMLSNTSLFVGETLELKRYLSDWWEAPERIDMYQQEQQRLLQENIMLQDQLVCSSSDWSLDPNFRLHSARIVRSNIGPRGLTFTINRGSRDGIQEDFGVLSSTGVLGKIMSVSKNYSLVMTLEHQLSAVNAQIGTPPQNGSLLYSAPMNAYFLESISAYQQVDVGDTLYTNSFSLHLPAGLRLGTVKSIEKDRDGLYYIIEVEPMEEIRDARLIFVSEFIDGNSVDSLQEEWSKYAQ